MMTDKQALVVLDKMQKRWVDDGRPDGVSLEEFIAIIMAIEYGRGMIGIIADSKAKLGEAKS